MQIHKIILYNSIGETRELEFNIGKVNIITGESKSGKSALIEIVNYCLGSKTCEIPEGIIRETVYYFALTAVFEDNETIFIARENPNVKQLQSTSTVYLRRNTSDYIPGFSEIDTNIDIDALKDFLSKKIGISENIHTPDGLTRDSLKANFKHARFYSYQPQYLIANPNQLFYNQNKEFIPQTIKDTLPYFLGAVNENSLAIENQISSLRRYLNRLMRQKKENEKIKEKGISKAYSLIQEAKEMGLLSEDTSKYDENNAFEILVEISKWENTPLEAKGENSAIKALIDDRNEKKIELGKFLDNKKVVTDYLKNSFGYSKEAKEQEIRLESIFLYENETISDNICPLCNSALDHSIPSVDNINKSLESIQQDLMLTRQESPRVQAYIETVNKQIHEVESDLSKIEASIAALYIENERARTLRDLNIRRGKIIGRISLFLESLSDTEENIGLDQQIKILNLKISDLEKLLDSENEKEKLLSILNKINLQMSKWVENLDVEDEDNPIRFDLNRLTIYIDSPTKPIALPQIGSGANWVAYHLLIILALHKHFVQKNRPVPRFIFIDQPTQVYYPPDKSEGVLVLKDNDDADEIAVSKMFNFIFKVAKELSPALQIIITDHAYLQNDNFRDSVIEVWRDGKKLVPMDWKRNIY